MKFRCSLYICFFEGFFSPLFRIREAFRDGNTGETCCAAPPLPFLLSLCPHLDTGASAELCSKLEAPPLSRGPRATSMPSDAETPTEEPPWTANLLKSYRSGDESLAPDVEPPAAVEDVKGCSRYARSPASPKLELVAASPPDGA